MSTSADGHHCDGPAVAMAPWGTRVSNFRSLLPGIRTACVTLSAPDSPEDRAL